MPVSNAEKVDTTAVNVLKQDGGVGSVTCLEDRIIYSRNVGAAPSIFST